MNHYSIFTILPTNTQRLVKMFVTYILDFLIWALWCFFLYIRDVYFLCSTLRPLRDLHLLTVKRAKCEFLDAFLCLRHNWRYNTFSTIFFSLFSISQALQLFRKKWRKQFKIAFCFLSQLENNHVWKCWFLCGCETERKKCHITSKLLEQIDIEVLELDEIDKCFSVHSSRDIAVANWMLMINFLCLNILIVF